MYSKNSYGALLVWNKEQINLTDSQQNQRGGDQQQNKVRIPYQQELRKFTKEQQFTTDYGMSKNSQKWT